MMVCLQLCEPSQLTNRAKQQAKDSHTWTWAYMCGCFRQHGLSHVVCPFWFVTKLFDVQASASMHAA
jgi:hypothetical protein